MCKIAYERSFKITKPTKFSRYIKFSMLKNSYYQETNQWKYLLHISGIDFGGDVTIQTKTKLIPISHSIFIISFMCYQKIS